MLSRVPRPRRGWERPRQTRTGACDTAAEPDLGRGRGCLGEAAQ